MEAILRGRVERFVRERRQWEDLRADQYARMFQDRLQRELADHGPQRRSSWESSMPLPPGLPPRDRGLQMLRIRCYARLLARRRVRQDREREGW